MKEQESLVIRRLRSAAEAEVCARMMAATEPWITLGRDYERSLPLIRDPAREKYLALHRKVLVGFAMLQMKGPFTGYIQSVCVAPEWRNRGIGGQLLEFAERRIFRDSPNVFLCVSSFNPDAMRLYIRRGYEIVGELRDYIVAGHSEILMRKTIGPLSEFATR